MPDAKRTWYGAFATLFGIGRAGRMPGTLGSAAAFLILLPFGGINIFALAAVILLGTVTADMYAKERGAEDPSEVVIDEVAGSWISMYGLDASSAIAAFFLFRVIDIVKPFPVDSAEKLPGGVGIMADDICGGIIVNVILRAVAWFFSVLFAGGFSAIGGYLGVGG
ncbi:MAG: phosphatidylglycerophosphatase A [Synergistaceae bacterium]|jgi:phosphatidylglycerophosphatase A|nr:phosphatidylglycerophosphatase A [Synergistaceae bacterium]